MGWDAASASSDQLHGYTVRTASQHIGRSRLSLLVISNNFLFCANATIISETTELGLAAIYTRIVHLSFISYS